MGAKNGGGGGRGRGGEDGTTSLDDLEQKAHDYVDSSEYVTEINNYFQDLLKDFNDRDVEGIKKHLETIIAALETEMDIIGIEAILILFLIFLQISNPLVLPSFRSRRIRWIGDRESESKVSSSSLARNI